MRIRKVQLALVCLSILGFAAGPPANAGFSNDDNVTMGGQPVFRILGGADGYTADHRAWLAQDALDNALVLASDRSPNAVTTGRANGAVIVTLDGRRVATADANSARLENLSAEGLAQKWADNIKGFLSDTQRTNDYVATLKGQHAIQASLLVERTLFVPAGFTFPISLVTAVSSDTAQLGDKVEATVTSDVALGNYVIPAGSILSGEIVADQNDSFAISFNRLRTPGGTEVPITAMVTDEYLTGSQGPHRVCTYAIPSGMANNIPPEAGRVPSSIAIGSIGEAGRHVLVFHKGEGAVAVGRPIYVLFENVTPVSVVMRDRAI